LQLDVTQISVILRFLSHCRSGGGGLRLTQEENRLEPDALLVEFLIFLNKKDES
jgi:hypothetical protein